MSEQQQERWQLSTDYSTIYNAHDDSEEWNVDGNIRDREKLCNRLNAYERTIAELQVQLSLAGEMATWAATYESDEGYEAQTMMLRAMHRFIDRRSGARFNAALAQQPEATEGGES